MTTSWYLWEANLGGGVPGWKGADGSTVEHGAPPPAPARPYFGACPTNVGTGGSAAVVSKFGAGASVRIFLQGFTDTLNIPANASVIHVSWKPTLSSLVAGSLDAQILSAIAPLPDGSIVTVHHEPDNNGWTATQRQQWKDGNNHFYDVVKAARPGLLVAPVFTGGLMASYTTNATRDLWCTGLKGDLFGVDCDGVHISTTEANYNRISYKDELDNCITYMAHPSNQGFRAVTVPEHATARVNPPDPNGTLRAAWFQAQTQLMIDRGVYAVMCYDYDLAAHSTTNNHTHIDPNSPELTVWRALVAANPATPRTS